MGIGLIGRDDLLARGLERLQQSTGLLLRGEAGVGKTRLLDEFIGRLTGHHVERFVATNTLQSVALGALIGVLPTEGDRSEPITAVRNEIKRRANGRPVVIAVDDAHLLDEMSLSCILHLVHQTDARPLLTVRVGEPTPSDLVQLWTSDVVEQVSVEPLPRAATAELVAAVLDAEPTRELVDEIYRLGQGVPLLTRELLFDALASGAVTVADERAEQVGELTAGGRIDDLVAARIKRLDPDLRELLELIAAVQPWPLELLDGADSALLDRLEQRRLASVSRESRRWVARVDHPLITDAIVHRTATRRRIGYLRNAAAALFDTDGSGEWLRAVRWLREVGDPIDPHHAIAAGHQALAAGDLDLAAALADEHLGSHPQPAHQLLGEVRRLQSRADEAEAALAVASGLATDDATICRIALQRSTLRAHHQLDIAGAIELLDTAAERVADDTRRLELRSESAFLAGLLGDFETTQVINERILATGDLDAPTRWLALGNVLFARAVRSQVDGADDVIDEMGHLAMVFDDERPEGVDLFQGLSTALTVARGGFVAREPHHLQVLQRRVADDRLHGFSATFLAILLAETASPHSIEIAELALNAIEHADPFVIAPITWAVAAEVFALHNHNDRALELLARVEPSHLADIRIASLIEPALAIGTAIDGDQAAAARQAVECGHRSVDTGYLLQACRAFHIASRFGEATAADGLEAAYESTTGSGYLGLLAQHARAVTALDAPTLVDLARRFHTDGALVAGFTALADAARLTDDPALGARAATNAALGGLGTRYHLHRDEPGLELAASRRELEVIGHVLTGRTSREIAAEMFLSVRTVENHLASVYRTHGLDGRDELRHELFWTPGWPRGREAVVH